MAEWFKDWFNTEEYLNVYRHRNEDDAKGLVDLILSKVNIPPGSKVLDMACGAGRHSIIFAQYGFKVTAVDLSEKLIKVAKKTAAETNVNVDFIESDLRQFAISEKFDLVVNLFTSFGYFEKDNENFKIIKTAFDHLKENGFFILDFFNQGYVEKNLIKKSVDIIPGGLITQERRIEKSRVEKLITINKYEIEQKFLESVRMFKPEELISAVVSTGFNVHEVLGDFDGNSFNFSTSPRVIILARK